LGHGNGKSQISFVTVGSEGGDFRFVISTLSPVPTVLPAERVILSVCRCSTVPTYKGVRHVAMTLGYCHRPELTVSRNGPRVSNKWY
jgi:hypothetical protein